MNTITNTQHPTNSLPTPAIIRYDLHISLISKHADALTFQTDTYYLYTQHLTNSLLRPAITLSKKPGFVLFNDTWSQYGQSVSCMTILFLNLQITRSDIRPYIKWAVSRVIAYGHFNLPRGLCGYVWVNMLTLSPPRVQRNKKSSYSVYTMNPTN